MVGRTLGPYEIRGHLGRGGTADVYRAVHRSLGSEVALKVLFEESSDDAEQIARFQRESRVLARLSHPGIVEVYDCGNEGAIHYFAMALLEHRTLSALLDIHKAAGGWLPEPQALAITTSILEVLTAVHAEHVIHRDLKPSNIFVTSDEQAIVSDFGLVKVIDETSLTAQPDRVLGTIQYMAPEQILSEPADARTDLYAVGLVLHRMLLGGLPFGDQMAEVVQKKTLFTGIKPLVPPNRELSPGLVDVLARACRRDRRERFQTAAEFHQALIAVQAGAVTPAPDPVAVPPRRATRHTVVAAVRATSGPRPTGLAKALAAPSGAHRRPHFAQRGLRSAVRISLLVLAGAAVGFGALMFSGPAGRTPLPADMVSVAGSAALSADGDGALASEVRQACRDVRALLASDCYQIVLTNVIEPDMERFRACFVQELRAVREARTRLAALEARLGGARDDGTVAALGMAARLALFDFLSVCRERSLIGLNAQLEAVLKKPAAQQSLLDLRTVMSSDAAGLARLTRHGERAGRLAHALAAAPDRGGVEMAELVEDFRLLAGLAPKVQWGKDVEAAVEQHLRALPEAVARAPEPLGAAAAAALTSVRAAAGASARGQLTRLAARTAVEDLATLRGLLPGARAEFTAILSEAWRDLDRVRTP